MTNHAPTRWAKAIGASAAIAFAAISALLLPSNAMAQTYPNKPIRIIIGGVPGSAIDVEARLFGQELTRLWGQPIIVESRAGASQSIAADIVAKAPPDGYTLGGFTSSILVSGLHATLPYDLERDLTPVDLTVTDVLLLVANPALPAHNVRELIALARSQPGKLNFGASQPGSVNHLAGELFNLMANVNIIYVPFKGATDINVAAMSGEVQLGYPSLVGTQELVDTGKLRALAVTAKTRSLAMPSVPTMDEDGLPGYEFPVWHGIWAPAGVPKNLVDRLHAAIVKIAHSPEVKTKLGALGLDPQNLTPQQFAARIHGDMAKMIELEKKLGL